MMSTRTTQILKAAFLRAFYVAGLSVSFFPYSATAGDWKITPRVSLEQSLTDNVRSVSQGAQSDLITTATAGIGINGKGRRLQLNFDYNLSEDVFWKNSDLNGYRQSLLGVGNVEVLEDHVFVDTRASINQESLQRNGGTSATARNVATNDQTTVVNYTITPNYKYRYGSWAESSTHISYNETQFLQTNVGSAATGALPGASHSVSIDTSVTSGQNFNRWSWTILGSKTFTNNSSNRDTLEFNNQYAWNRHFSLLGTVGRETIEGSGINSNNSAEFYWSGGARLTPGPRSTIRVEYGRRFNSSTFSGDASYKFSPRTSINATYNVTVQTDRQQLTQNLNNLVLNDQGVLVNPNTGLPGDPNNLQFDFLDRTSKTQNFTIALNGTRGRNSFNLNSSVLVRTQLPENTSDTVVTFGGNFNRRIWPDLTGGLTANYSATTESSSGVKDFTVNSSAFLNYQIGENFNGRLQYSLLYRNSDINTADLQENVISVSLNKTF